MAIIIIAYASGVSVSVFDIGIGMRHFCRYFYVGSVFGIGILKYRDIGIGIRFLPLYTIFGITRPQQLASCLNYA